MTESIFDAPPDRSGLRKIDTRHVGPPSLMAYVALAFAGGGIAIGLLWSGAAHVGYALGVAAVLAGIAYRWMVRLRQMTPRFLPNYVVTRLMLTGVAGGFVAIVLNAFHLAQRTIS